MQLRWLPDTPDQIYPNLKKFSEIKESAKTAIAGDLGVFDALADEILDLNEVAQFETRAVKSKNTLDFTARLV